jgi:hypothetical protein
MSPTSHLSLVAIGLAVAAFLVAGCGVGSSPEQKVSETTDTYLRSLAAGEHDAACDQLTVGAKSQLEEPCPAAMRAIAARFDSDDLTAAADAGFEIDQDGGQATVTIPELADARLTLLPSGERWRINAGYALA